MPHSTCTCGCSRLSVVLTLSDEVTEALSTGGAVVALESTILAHGLPAPQNREVAARIEAAVRNRGAVPATIAVLDGRVTVGLIRRRAGPGLRRRRLRQAERARPRRRRRPRTQRRHHRGLDLGGGGGRGHRRVRHRRPGRGAPRLGLDPGHLRRPRRTGPHPGGGRLRRGEVDPRRAGDAGIPGDQQCAGARLPDRRVPRLLPRRLRRAGVLAGGERRRGRRRGPRPPRARCGTIRDRAGQPGGPGPAAGPRSCTTGCWPTGCSC